MYQWLVKCSLNRSEDSVAKIRSDELSLIEACGLYPMKGRKR